MTLSEWIARHAWIGRRRRFGIAVWDQPYGPVLTALLGDRRRLPIVERAWPYATIRIPLTRWCLATYRRVTGAERIEKS